MVRTVMRFRIFRSQTAALLGAATLCATAAAQTAPAQQSAGQNGVITLPQTPPPTGLQSPLPKAIAGPPRSERPALVSPRPSDIPGAGLNRPITIDDALSIALSTNRSLALAIANLELLRGRTAEAKAALNPTVSGSASYSRLSQESTANINGRTLTLSSADQANFGLTISLPLYTELLRTATDQARFQEIAARLDINRTRNQIALDVKSAFYDVLRAQALVAVNTENLQNSVDRLDDAQKRYRAGVVARFDVLRAETDVLNAQQSLIAARSQVSLAIATLNNTIGIDVNTPLKISEQGATEDPPGVEPPRPAAQPLPQANEQAPARLTAPEVGFDSLNLGPQFDAVTREALRQRPEILEADANIVAAQKGIRLARRSLYPSFGVSLSGSYTPLATGFSPQYTTGQASLSVTLPIFDGGVTRARVQQARAEVSTAETNRRQSLDQVALEVRSAYLQLVQSRDRVAVANQALAQAQEAFRLARVRYNAGVSAQAGISPLLEVSDAQAALTQAESNRVNALYDYNNNRARLDKAVGRYSYGNLGPGYSAPPVIKR